MDCFFPKNNFEENFEKRNDLNFYSNYANKFNKFVKLEHKNKNHPNLNSKIKNNNVNNQKNKKEKENYTHYKELINEKIKLNSNNPDLINININREKDEININNNDINYDDFFEKEKHLYMKNLYSNYQTKINSKEKDNKTSHNEKINNLNDRMNSKINMNLNINDYNNLNNNMIIYNNKKNTQMKNQKNVNKIISSFSKNLGNKSNNYIYLNHTNYKGENPELYINFFNNIENSFEKLNNEFFRNNLCKDDYNINFNYNLINHSKEDFNSTEIKNNNFNVQNNILNGINENNHNKNFNNSKNKLHKNTKNKKYIFMSDVLKNPPTKINCKCKKVYSINNNIRDNENEIILFLKVRVDKVNNLEIIIRKNDDIVFVLENFFKEKGLDRNQKEIIKNYVLKCLNLICNFSYIEINNNTKKKINDIQNYFISKN